jgi:hypothetical protein
MKKVMLFMGFAVTVLVACNSNSTPAASNADSLRIADSIRVADSTAAAQAAADSAAAATATPDSAAAATTAAPGTN